MHSSFPCRRGLSILAEIGGLSQEESDQFIRQLFNVRRARRVAHWTSNARDEHQSLLNDDQNDTLLFEKLQEYILAHYPNPERVGCASP
jgi:hypothetical protein